MLDFLFLLLFLYLAFIAIVGSIALYGKAIDKIPEKNLGRAVKIHGFLMKALKFAFVVVCLLRHCHGVAFGYRTYLDCAAVWRRWKMHPTWVPGVYSRFVPRKV